MRFLFALVGLFMCGAAYATPAVVNYIFDGDTPEIHGACAREINMAKRARDRLAELIPIGTTVELKDIKDDKYLGRIDANVIMADGRDVGRVLIEEGLGRPYAGGRRAPWCF